MIQKFKLFRVIRGTKKRIFTKVRQRYNKKCTYASEARNIFHKMIDFIYLIRYSSLIQARLRMRRWIADDKVLTVFVKYISSELEYGLHHAKVATRECEAGRCSKVQLFSQ
jgi:hypothetical protein